MRDLSKYKHRWVNCQGIYFPTKVADYKLFVSTFVSLDKICEFDHFNILLHADYDLKPFQVYHFKAEVYRYFKQDVLDYHHQKIPYSASNYSLRKATRIRAQKVLPTNDLTIFQRERQAQLEHLYGVKLNLRDLPNDGSRERAINEVQKLHCL